jgi:hypothetical protein
MTVSTVVDNSAVVRGYVKSWLGRVFRIGRHL